MNEKSKNENLTLEQSFEQVEGILSELDGEEISLEKSFELYTRGMQLLADCNEKISGVEQQLKVLREDGENEL